MKTITILFLSLFSWACLGQTTTAGNYDIPRTGGAGLTFHVGPGASFTTAGSLVSFAGNTYTLGQNVTTYVYIDLTSGSVTTNTTGFPSSNVVPLAHVVTDTEKVKTVTDDRPTYGAYGGAGSGNPAGSSGQLQYNNSGSFGGFTLAGDCTFSVPNITCTTLNGSTPGTISGQANGVVPLATGATAITAQSHMDDGNTTASTIHSSENVETSGTMTTGVGGSTAGLDALAGNTSNPSLPNNSIGFLGPTSASLTSYFGQFPAAAPAAGIMLWGAPSSNVSTLTFLNESDGNIIFGSSGVWTKGTALPNGVTATSQAAQSNDTKVATDAYVDTHVVNTVVDTSTPVTVSAQLGAEYHFNENATAGTAITYNLVTAAAGKQFCFSNANNGSAADTGALTIATSATGQFIIFTDGTLSATGGNVVSSGAAADAACVVGVDSTHWVLYVQRGSWTKH